MILGIEDNIAFFLRFGYICNQKSGNKFGESLLRGDKKSKASPIDIHQQLTQALEKILGINNSPALLLSGGIDSPLIAAVAQSLSPKPLKAFTFSTQDKTTDEADQAARYADEIGLEHQIVTLDPKDLPEIILELMPHCDEPPGFYSIIPTYLVCKQAKNHADVILSGDGADELFWGYASRMSRVIRLAPLFRLPK